MVIYTASYTHARLAGPGFDAACVFGKSGLVASELKREGDGATPIGLWPVRRAFYRADRLTQPASALRLDPIHDEDGWCDAQGDGAYNRPVRLPYPASHERLKREDGLYDLIVVLGHNDDPASPGAGSAIFLHCRPDHDRGTLGCIAIAREDLVTLIGRLQPGDAIAIEA